LISSVTESVPKNWDHVSSFELAWRNAIKRFDASLAIELNHLLAKAPMRLAEAIRYSVLAPGKRLRPMLAIWAGEAVGGEFDACLPAAFAVELIHCYSLIHDDLPAMDDDDLRRGLPTCHVQFDEATAILAGDALQPMAFEILATKIKDPAVAQRAILRLSHAAGPDALVGGQADDLRAEKEGGGEDLLQAIHARKTGAMIEVSVVLGGFIADGTEEQLGRLSEYGKAIGQAFQIVDDLLDVVGSTEELGKRAGKDCQRGKLTYPRIYGVEASRQAASDYTGKAVQIAESFGSQGENLVRLARHLLERTH
jgi:geranylgeranyl diphosphate synthase, type II